MTMTLTCDHRAIDGSEGAEFLRDLEGVRRGAGARAVACSRMVIRRGGRQDVRFLRDMLHHAYYWREREPGEGAGPVALYVKGWGRPGDTALIAVEDAFPVGAAWYRLFRRDQPGYGFVDEETPELAIAVVPSRRGRGIGDALLNALFERAQGGGPPRAQPQRRPGRRGAPLVLREARLHPRARGRRRQRDHAARALSPAD